MKFLVSILTVFIFLGSCTKEPEIQKNDYFVSLEQAIEIAKKNVQNKNVKRIDNTHRSDEFTTLNSITLHDESNIPALYIINYRGGNEDFFNIISADSRLDYVIAYGEGVIESDDIVEGLSIWISEIKKVVHEIRVQNLSKPDVLTKVIQGKVLPDEESDCCEECPNYPECEIRPWIGCGDSNIDCEYDPCEGISLYNSVGPIMSSVWGQNCFYNDDCPVLGCTLGCGSNRALTGCVATAMSQIIRHHEHPIGYDYANMLDNYNGLASTTQIDAVADLMLDAGTEVSMIWGCNISGVLANIYCGEVTDAFTNSFNYSQASGCFGLSSSVHSTIRNNIDNSRPVIFSGFDNRGGHAWVSDGYRQIRHCEVYDENQQLIIVYTLRNEYYMNWGFNGAGNGWFDYSTWGGNFNTDQEVIYNIRP